MATKAILNLDPFPSIKNFLDEWNKSWKVTSAFLEWLQNWSTVVETSASKVNDFILGLDPVDYRNLIDTPSFDIKKKIFSKCLVKIPISIEKSYDMVEDFNESNDLHKDLLLSFLSNWINKQCFGCQLKVTSTNFFEIFKDEEMILTILKECHPFLLKDATIKANSASFFSKLQSVIDDKTTFGKFNFDNNLDLLRFVQCLMEEHMTEVTQNLFGVNAYEACLIRWWQEITLGYNGIKINDLSESFANGLAICAFIHKFQKGSIDYSSLSNVDPVSNWRTGLEMAKEIFQIRPLFDAADVPELVRKNSKLLAAFAFECLNRMRGMTNELPLCCPLCADEAVDEVVLYDHLRTKHLSRPLSQLFDWVMLQQYQPLQQQGLPQEAVVCCDIEFSTMADYHKHQMLCHDTFTCIFKKCYFTHQTKDGIYEHVNKHVPFLTECHTCNQSLGDVLSDHVRHHQYLGKLENG